MDYEKKYKEALERMKSWAKGEHPECFSEAQKTAEFIFPELKESEGDRMRKNLYKCLRYYVPNDIAEEYIKWLEKQGEKMTKPKFNVGDWIVNNVCFPMQIASIKDGMYIFTKGDAMSVFFIDGNFHLWTIQDAMDGDVLVNWNNTTFIFKAIEDETVKFHIAYNEKWDTIKTPSTKLSHLGLPESQFEFHPATKEQRDLLFSKMKETGYEWDSEKKELKKIEPK